MKKDNKKIEKNENSDNKKEVKNINNSNNKTDKKEKDNFNNEEKNKKDKNSTNENIKNVKATNKSENKMITKNDGKGKKKLSKEEKKKIREEKRKDKKLKKDKETNKAVQYVKRKWLIDGSRTLSLIFLILAAFFGINTGMQVLDLAPIDFTEEKLYTLTEESRERIKKIDKNVNIYFVGYSEDAANFSLAKQYNDANEKIIVETADASNRPDLVEKYGIQSDSSAIIIESEGASKILVDEDLLTYDSQTYETISIAEEKLTSSIISVVTEDIPKVYFLEGYSNFSIYSNMYYLSIYMGNEIMEVDTLNILSTGNIPEDCNTLVITSPSEDFDDVAKTAIIDYINKGGNILWLNAAIATSKELPNVNEILALYGINSFEVGVIRETDKSKMLSGSPDLILPDLGYTSKITEDLYSNGVVLANATKININTDGLADLNVLETYLAMTSSEAYFRTDFTIDSTVATEGEELGPFIVGAEMVKTISEANEETGENEVTSTLVVYGENYFASDYQIVDNSNYQIPAVEISDNKDLILNSLAYLTDREEDISARKSTGTVTYTSTENQDTVVKIIIFAMPAIFILVGLIVWQRRRRQ